MHMPTDSLMAPKVGEDLSDSIKFSIHPKNAPYKPPCVKLVKGLWKACAYVWDVGKPKEAKHLVSLPLNSQAENRRPVSSIEQ